MNLFERVKAILLNPRAEWSIIEREPGDVAYLFMNYVAILAAIPAVCGFIGTSLIGISLPGLGTVRVPIVTGLVGAVVGYLLTFAMVYIVALLADLLAPTFQGQKNSENALKLVVYSYTPAWLAGVFLLIPSSRLPRHPRALRALSVVDRNSAADESAAGKIDRLYACHHRVRDRHRAYRRACPGRDHAVPAGVNKPAEARLLRPSSCLGRQVQGERRLG